MHDGRAVHDRAHVRKGVWQAGMWGGGIHGGGMCGKGYAWQGKCMAGGVHGRGCAWQERRPLQRTVRILLECILVNFWAIFQSYIY